MILENIGLFASFMGGLSAFFSAWQLCIMQISPFFLAFAIAFYLVEARGSIISIPSIISLLILSAAFAVTFSIFFGLLGTNGFYVSRYLKYNLGTLKKFAAVVVAVTAFLLFYKGILRRGGMSSTVVNILIGLFFGVSLAVSYSPCITPVMSRIMNFAMKPENAAPGFFMLAFYGIGLSAALTVTGVAGAMGVAWLMTGKTLRSVGIAFSSFLLLLLSLMLIFGVMGSYKSFLVGMFME